MRAIIIEIKQYSRKSARNVQLVCKSHTGRISSYVGCSEADVMEQFSRDHDSACYPMGLKPVMLDWWQLCDGASWDKTINGLFQACEEDALS